MRWTKFVTARQVENGLDSLAGRGERRGIQQIAFHEFDLRAKQVAGLVGVATKQSESATATEKGVNHVAPNKTRRTSDENWSIA